MSVIRYSLRAFVAALVPLAILRALMSALGVAGYLAYDVRLPTPDRTAVIFLLQLAIDAILLLLGHAALRALRLPTRVAYGLMGGVAAGLGYVATRWAEIWIASPPAGTWLIAAILPVLVGMISGFLYAQFAGRQSAPSRRTLFGGTAATTPPAMTPYDGPVQVRMSIAATVIAATMPALLVATLAMPFAMWMFNDFFSPPAGREATLMSVLQFAVPAQAFMVMLIATAVPSAIVVVATHAIARGRGCTHGRDYALIGAAVNSLAALLLVMLIPFGLLLPLAAVIGAMMGAIYRRFAGLEPLALPEAVLVEDTACLVAADHPARHSHAVITNG